MDIAGRYEFQVRSYECGASGVATLPSVCNYLQEAASLHAEELGFSKSSFASEGENISWVLTRLRVKMARYPRWEEKVAVVTFPRGGRRITAYRDFLLCVGEETIGVATTEWMIIDLSTRKMVVVPAFVYDHTNDVRSPVLGEDPFAKLRWRGTPVTGGRRFRARRGDIDLNGHVNNVHYIEWIVETLPESISAIRDFEIVFKSETLAGDEVCAETVEVSPGVWSSHVVALDGRDHVVARTRCRS